MVAPGDTTLVPVKATLPIPWSILAVAAPELLHLSVEKLPDAMFPGLAVKEFMTGALAAANTPSETVIKSNAEVLARYAAICQEHSIVPIVEPEVLMDGNHTIQRCAEVTEEVLIETFKALVAHKVQLEYIILKPNMMFEPVTATIIRR